MPTKHSLTEHYITPKQVFIAYAKWQSSQNALPKTKAFHETRWLLIAEQLGLSIDELHERPSHDLPGATMLKGLVSKRANCSHYVVVGRPHIGQYPDLDTSIERAHLRSLMKKAHALRSEYDEMGGELFDQLFPEIRHKKITWNHLIGLGLPVKPPNQTEEWLEFMESDAEEPSPFPKHWTREEIADMKRQEREEAEAKVAHDQLLDQVRMRAIEQGFGTMEQINHVLHDMPAGDFLKLVCDLPPLTRGDFRPDRFTPQPPYVTL
jgi:hypothetical protein